jgi:asparagine synthase (glutamine-hydrolysing)
MIQPELLRSEEAFDEFRQIFWGRNVGRESYFDSMTHFDFKTLLPALLHVEDRVSMAHGLESRVPMLDHRLVELAATIPANIKFQNGELKRLLRAAFGTELPSVVLHRKDKMGFPVPLQAWLKRPGPVREFVLDTFRSARARSRSYLSGEFDIERLIDRQGPFSRNAWAFLCLELWQQRFHDSHVHCEDIP